MLIICTTLRSCGLGMITVGCYPANLKPGDFEKRASSRISSTCPSLLRSTLFNMLAITTFKNFLGAAPQGKVFTEALEPPSLYKSLFQFFFRIPSSVNLPPTAIVDLLGLEPRFCTFPLWALSAGLAN